MRNKWDLEKGLKILHENKMQTVQAVKTKRKLYMMSLYFSLLKKIHIMTLNPTSPGGSGQGTGPPNTAM